MIYLHQLWNDHPDVVRAELRAAAKKARDGASVAKCNFARAELECFIRAESSVALTVAMRRSNGRGVKEAEVQTVVACLSGSGEITGVELAPARHSHDVWLVVRITGPSEPAAEPA